MIFSGHESLRSTMHFWHSCSSIIIWQPQLSYPLSFVLPNMNCVQLTNKPLKPFSTKERAFPVSVSVSLPPPPLSSPPASDLLGFCQVKSMCLRTWHPFQISMTHRTYVRPSTRKEEPRSDSCRYAPPPLPHSPNLQNNFLLSSIHPFILDEFLHAS